MWTCLYIRLCDFSVCIYVCVCVCVCVCDVWIMEADCWGPEQVSGCCWEHERVSEGGKGLVSKPDLQNQCPYKRANDRIRGKANITKTKRGRGTISFRNIKPLMYTLHCATKKS